MTERENHTNATGLIFKSTEKELAAQVLELREQLALAVDALQAIRSLPENNDSVTHVTYSMADKTLKKLGVE